MTQVCFTGQLGQRWRYWDDQQLGNRGNFGAVYAAQSSTGQPMAVKVVQKNLISASVGDRLLWREVDVGRRVTESQCEMLLPVIDAVETEESLLLVMERAEEDLSEISKPMTESDAISVMLDIASGLLELHLTGIIHRDLKPANVLRHQGRWKLADFGIAHDEEIGTQDLTFIGWGSPPYMAPELWEMKSPTVSTDLYALGCLAYELLRNEPPYLGNREQIRAGHMTGSPPDPPASNILLKRLMTALISKHPSDRPQDARDVLNHLRRAPRPLSTAQRRIVTILADQAAERNHAAARSAKHGAAEDRRRQLIDRSRQVLLEIAEETLESIRDIGLAGALEEREMHPWEADLKYHVRDPFEAVADPEPRRDITGPSIFLTMGASKLRIDYCKQDYCKGIGIAAGKVVLPGRPAWGWNVKDAVPTIGRPDSKLADLIYQTVGIRHEWREYRSKKGRMAEVSTVFNAESLLEIISDALTSSG